MTTTASYDSLGNKVFSFPTHLYSKGDFSKIVNNTEYELLDFELASFDSNDLVVFQGNDGGYFLTIMHHGEPVDVLDSFICISELEAFLENKRSDCEKFNLVLSDNDVFFSYFLLVHRWNHCRPELPHFHLLISKVRTMEFFYLLFNCYESLYNKRREYGGLLKGGARTFFSEEFYEMLTEEEMSVLKFSVFCNSNDNLFSDSWQKSLLHSLSELKYGAFEVFGIQDCKIELLFQVLKMHPYYFIYRIRKMKMKPSVYYFEGDIFSYLRPEDELILWRSGKMFREYLATNYEDVLDINEPEDRG